MEEKVVKSFRIDPDVFRRFRAALVLNGKDSDKDADDVVEKLLDGYFKEAIGEHVPAQQSSGFEGFDLDRPKSTSFLSIRAARAYTMPDALASEEDAETDEQKERERTERKIRRWAEKRDSVPYFIIRAFLLCDPDGSAALPTKQELENFFVKEYGEANGGTDEELRQRFARNFAQMKIARDNSHGLIFGESDGKIFIREEFRELIRGLENKFLAEPKNTEEGEAQ